MVKPMSKLEKLIAELCPDGVEYQCLDEVLDYEQPTKYIVESTSYDDNFTIPVLTAGASFILGYTDEKEGIYLASPKYPVIIFDDFTTSFHWVDFNFKVKSSAMKILTAKDETLATLRYLYFVMKCIPFEPSQHARHWIQTYSKFRIPLPPLPIQEEIVRILDKFTTLEAELEAELEARNKQYEYYSDELLTFGEDVPVVEIEEMFDIRNGYTPSKANAQYWEGGTIPWFRMEDIRTNGRILSNAIQHVSEKAVKGKGTFPSNSIIVATSATIGEHALITCPALTNQRFVSLCPKAQYKKKVDIKYLFYYFFVVDEWCKRNLNEGNFASVDMGKFVKYKIPVPPLEEQARIVAMLDRFDALVNDITHGLPAEIAARRKQYEYYRDKLLTFKEKVS
jgi:type I restriction enzyme, S subunit